MVEQMLEIEKSGRLVPFGNIYRSSYNYQKRSSSSSSSSPPKNDESSTSNVSLHGASMQRSLSLNPIPVNSELHRSQSQCHSPPGVEDGPNMTIEFLRARLLAERSTAKSARMKIQELEKKVQELERRLQIEVEKRMQAESALQESLEKMLDSGSSSSSNTDSELESYSRSIELHENGREDEEHFPLEAFLMDPDESGVDSEEIQQQESNAEEKFMLQKGEEAEEVGGKESTSFHQLEEEEEEDDEGEVGAGLSLPCAETLEPHIHSDSDWATDDDCNKLNSSSAFIRGGGEFESDSEDDWAYGDHSSSRVALPSQLHLAQLDLANKIGRSLRSISKPRSPKESCEINDWVHQVVQMLDKKMNKVPSTENIENQENHEELVQPEDPEEEKQQEEELIELTKLWGDKDTQLIGVDNYGNKYYEKKSAQDGRSRWVEYADKRYYDASRVPPEWHAWLHHMSHRTGYELEELRPTRYGIEHQRNRTGEGEEFIYHSKGHVFNPNQRDWTRYDPWNKSDKPPTQLPTRPQSKEQLLHESK